MGERQKSGAVTIIKAGQNLGPAFRSAWPYTLIGLFIGVSLLFLKEHLEGKIDHTLILVIEHLGMGFIVSAIAVFFYEWGAHIKNALELSEELNDVLKNKIEPIATAMANQALDRSLSTLIVGEKGLDNQNHSEKTQLFYTISCIKSLVDSISYLRRKNIWANGQYIGFIYELLQSASSNAKSLMNLEQTSEQRFSVPSAGQMADRILAAQMQAMEKDDQYDTISNLTAWQGDQLKDFHESSLEAIRTKGVKVRRIFNLLRDEYRHLEITPEEIKIILEKHLNDVERLYSNQKTDGYEVRILRESDLTASTSQILFHEKKLLREKIFSAHFGIFTHGEHTLRVRVEELTLSKMIMSKDNTDIQADIILFNSAWKAAKKLDQGLINGIVKQIQDKRQNYEKQNGISLNVFLQKRSELPNPRHLIGSATQLYIMAISGNSWLSSYSGFLQEKLKNGSELRFLLLNYLSDEIVKIWNERCKVSNTKDSIEDSLKILNKLMPNTATTNFTVKLTNILPPFSMVIVDPDKDEGFLIVEFHTYKTNIDDRPFVILRQSYNKDWFDFYKTQFDEIWKEAQPYPL